MMDRNGSVDTNKTNKSSTTSLEDNAAPFLSTTQQSAAETTVNVEKPRTNYVKWGTGNHKARRRDIPTDTRPLHTATQTGSVSTIKSLLSRVDADVNEEDNMGKSPLHIASKALDVRIMRLLIDYNADVNKLDKLQMNPLHYVLLSGKRNRSKAVIDCMELLISKGVNVNAVDVTGQTALHFAAIRSQEEWVDVLVRNGAQFCGRLNDESSSLYIAIKNCPNSIMTNLDICIVGFDGRMNEDKLSIKNSIKTNAEIMLNYEHLQTKNPVYPAIKNDPTVFFMNILDLKKNNDDPNFQTSIRNIFLHPATQAYIYFRWFKAKWLYYTMVLLAHFLYSILLSTYGVLVYKDICKPEPDPFENWIDGFKTLSRETTCTVIDENENIDHWTETLIAIACWVMLIPFNCVFVVKELTKVGQQLSNLKSYNVGSFLKALLNYITDAESFLSWLIIYSFFIVGFHEFALEFLTTYSTQATNNFNVARYQYHVCAYGLFMTWLLMMLMIGRSTELGLYVGMLKTVSKTFMSVLSSYICLVLAFVLSFFILFNDQHTFADSFPTMIIKVSV